MIRNYKSFVLKIKRARDARPIPPIQLLSFHAFFDKNLAKCFRPQFQGSVTPCGKSWIRHCNKSGFDLKCSY